MTTNIAKQAFEIPNKGGSSSDYLKNKKSKLMYCNRSGHCNNKLVSSYAEKNIIQNGRNLETPVDSITFHLYSNLDTQLNYTGLSFVVVGDWGNQFELERPKRVFDAINQMKAEA